MTSPARTIRNWNRPFYRWFGTLLVCAGLYALYAVTIVPRVEPASIVRRRSPVDLATYENLPLDDKSEFAGLFPEDAWEWQPCKTLETDQGKILFKDYQQNEDGTWDVMPFTLVLESQSSHHADAAPADTNSDASPIVLRAANRARLRFNRPLKLGSSQGDPIRLEQAQLLGRVTLTRSDEQQPIWIDTSNVQIDPQTIRTLERVEFQMGAHRGAGRNMLIELDHQTSAAQLRNDFENINGFRRIQVAFLDHLTLSPDRHRAAATAADRADHATLLRSGDAPIQIRCSGPFEFDYRRHRASFREQVSARQLRDHGDWLKCDQLDIHFRDSSRRPLADRHEPAPPFQQLKIVQVVASGQPAVLTSPTQQVQIVGEYLHYDLESRTLDGKSESSVQIQHHDSRFAAPQITYTMADDGGLGKLDAVGAGTMTRATDDAEHPMTARWQNFMRIRPAEHQTHLVILDGRTRVQLNPHTQIQSQSLKLWIREEPLSTPDGKPMRKFRPQQMIALNDVQLASRSLRGSTHQLVVHWPDDARPLSRHQPDADSSPFAAPATYTIWPVRDAAARGAVASPQTPLQPVHRNVRTARRIPLPPATVRDDQPVSPTPPWEFTSDNVTIQWNEEGQPVRFREVELTGQVHLWQREAVAAPNSSPPPIAKQLKGDRLVVVPLGTELYRFDVWGMQDHSPVMVQANGMLMTGPHVALDQQANRLWVDGAGRLVYRAPAEPQAKNRQPRASSIDQNSAASQDLDVTWGGGMIFDGQRMYFENSVAAHVTQRRGATSPQPQTLTHTSSAALTVTLDRPVRLADQPRPGSPRTPSQSPSMSVRELLLVSQIPPNQRVFSVPVVQASHQSGKVTLVNETLNARGEVLERRELTSESAVILPDSQSITAHGPGELTIYRRHQPSQSSANQWLPTQTALAHPPSKNGLDYLQLLFDGRLVASGDSKDMKANGNVRVLYGNVQNTEQRPSADTPRHVSGTVRLTCETVELAQWRPQSSAGPTTSELIATGNAHIVADRFEATAHRVSYDQASDFVTIEGTTREDAHLWTRPKPGAPANHLVAAKIRYRPSDQATHIDRVRSATFHGQ